MKLLQVSIRLKYSKDKMELNMSSRDIEIAEGLFIQENIVEGKIDALYLTAL